MHNKSIRLCFNMRLWHCDNNLLMECKQNGYANTANGGEGGGFETTEMVVRNHLG